jgi:hypothetical protein
MKASLLGKKLVSPEDEAMSSALYEMSRRLEILQRRVERLEAAIGARGVAASNADDFGPIQAPRPADSAASKAPIQRQGETSAPRGSAGDAPVTERLDRVPGRHSAEDPFPDLSLLDEKVEPRKGPAERLGIRAALEDYPRISERIQQLWGTPDCEAYLNSLVIDTRGNRQGFPPPIMEELLYLGRLARALVILQVGGDLWEAFDQVGDRR